jgi:hypothetical protein
MKEDRHRLLGSILTVQATDVQSMRNRRPRRSIVQIVGTLPSHRHVVIAAARIADTFESRPILENITEAKSSEQNFVTFMVCTIE